MSLDTLKDNFNKVLDDIKEYKNSWNTYMNIHTKQSITCNEYQPFLDKVVKSCCWDGRVSNLIHKRFWFYSEIGCRTYCKSCWDKRDKSKFIPTIIDNVYKYNKYGPECLTIRSLRSPHINGIEYLIRVSNYRYDLYGVNVKLDEDKDYMKQPFLFYNNSKILLDNIDIFRNNTKINLERIGNWFFGISWRGCSRYRKSQIWDTIITVCNVRLNTPYGGYDNYEDYISKNYSKD
jgi:hypothetical protein